MRDLMMLGVMVVLLPLAFSNTFIAYLLWGWIGLIALNFYLFGFMASLPYAQIFAVVTLAMVFIRRDKEQARFKLNRTLLFFIVFGLHAMFVAAFAYDGLPRNWEIFINILKTLLFCALMPMLVTNRLRIHALVVMIVLGLSFHGMLDGLKFLATAGGHVARGVAKFGDNNYLAMALATSIPLLLYLFRYSKNIWAKLGFGGVMVLTVLAVVATHSRGGLLTLLVLAVWVIWHSPRKVAGLTALLVCGALVVALAPESWSERMNTMKSAGDDSSFMTRVAVWKKSTAIALEHPVFGGGFYAVQSEPTYNKYRTAQGLMGFINTPDPGMYAAHSIYFQVMGDMGFVGLFIYMGLLLNVFITRLEIKRLANTQGDSAIWASDLADMLAAGMLAFMMGGALLSAAYLEIPFLLIALMEVTKQQLLPRKQGGVKASQGVLG